MQVYIIHCSRRTDRIPNIAKLLGAFPYAKLVDAIEPVHEWSPHNKAMLGCSLSHLKVLQEHLHQEPIMVLEDDAVIEGAIIPDLSGVPENASAVVLGGEASFYGEDLNGFRRVLPELFGTQAMVYYPRLKTQGMIPVAYEVIAKRGIGKPEEGRICFESLLLTASMVVGLEIFRPSGQIPFTTVEDFSETRQEVTAPRERSGPATDGDSLLPWSVWEPVFAPWSGKTAHILPVLGNVGDQLLVAATRQLMAHYNIEEASFNEAEVLFYPPGGNIGGQYDFRDQDRVFPQDKRTKVVLPQSWLKQDDYADLADVSWAREQTSLQFAKEGTGLSQDLALAYKPSVIRKPEQQEEGVFFRKDAEATNTPIDNIADPASEVPDYYLYLKLAGAFGKIHTNRLHFAIASMIMGSETMLYPNSYHKNRSVFDHSLEALGCSWSELNNG